MKIHQTVKTVNKYLGTSNCKFVYKNLPFIESPLVKTFKRFECPLKKKTLLSKFINAHL